MCRVEISPAAGRDLGKLKERIQRGDFEKLRDTIGKLAEEPRPHGVRKIKGTERAFRIRACRFRDKEILVLVLQVVKRSEATYRELS